MNERATSQESEMNKAKVLVIHCIDLRFQEMMADYLSKRDLNGAYDRISWPGASIDAKNVETASGVSLRLHDPDEVVIIEHEDCGAYGENNAEEIHRQNAQKLAEALKQQKPDLIVTPLIATFDGIKPL